MTPSLTLVSPAPVALALANGGHTELTRKWVDLARRWFVDAEISEGMARCLSPAQIHCDKVAQVSVTGPARMRNEDAVLSLSLAGERQALIVADGMGGHPDGHLASRLAVLGAARVLAALTRGSTEAILGCAFHGAARLLTRASAAGEVHPDAGTTLIVAILEANRYVIGWIGDGGAYVRRQDGVVETVVHPHKAGLANVLERYLSGTSSTWECPSVATLPRECADLLLVGTDGVMDRVAPKEMLDWLWEQCRGEPLGAALATLIEHFAGSVDQGMPVAEDNMTLVAVLTETKQAR
ncbi:MAG: protein phosphatase 2C domain-containing protein [Rhodocyclaceae bacterium]|nr:protein phosphatase 2C domain-containing protein [Rhodocyclaceae bacterium]MCA3857969.1 protein phosphatase 2C domain-containing protein [Burkholderia sp.]MCA3118421.1 protein phosphatase 2C domain-containing protein [Rhodocyclaceae bacterium]MCA3127999.1 protein phosphatase 2C domain-containing protein [Rhodocyclaceae bacterium]MCA3138111.1 protein phosphatase 2C domain-containing protein [Rhodocyclaceae bacterium]